MLALVLSRNPTSQLQVICSNVTQRALTYRGYSLHEEISTVCVIVRALTEPSRLPSSEKMLSTERRMSSPIHYMQTTRGKSYQTQVMETSLKTQLYKRDIQPHAPWR